MKTKKTEQKKVVKVMVTLKNRSHPYPRVGLDVETDDATWMPEGSEGFLLIFDWLNYSGDNPITCSYLLEDENKIQIQGLNNNNNKSHIVLFSFVWFWAEKL